MFNKKTRRNFRQRKENSSDDEDEQKNRGDGEEGEKAAAAVNKLSKLAQGRGITCSSKRETTPPKSASSDDEDGETVEVTEEREEKNQDRDGVKTKTNAILSFSDDKEEPTFKLKKSSDKAVLFQVRRKEASAAKTSQTAARRGVAASASPRQDHGSQASPQDLHRYDDDDEDYDDDDSDVSSLSAASASASDSSCSPAKPIVIPNAEEIKAARRQRHNIQTQKDFIPLSRAGHSSAGSTPEHYSREEERVDDDDDEHDDHERRIEFAPRLKSIRERIAEKLGMRVRDGLGETDLNILNIFNIPSGSESSSYSSSSCSRRDRGRQKKRSTGLKIPTLPSISISMVKKRITGKLDSLKEVHRARQAELRRMENDVEGAKTSAESLEESSSEKQLRFYRAMTIYVHNLVECLREKVMEINSLELELHSLLSDQTDVLLAQRRERMKEQADLLQQLSCESHLSVHVSTFAFVYLYNMSLTRSQAVFSDVQSEFCDVKKILSRFEEWRGSYSESYHSAYISLCLPKLLNPIIRNNLLAWNPLKSDSGDFETLPWFTAVETFCHGHGYEELEHTDRETLSNVIEKTVVPKITAYVELVWDPMSRHQSVCLSGVCHRLKEDYSIFEGEQSKAVKTFKEAVISRLRSCVDEDVFIPLYPKKFLDDRLSSQRRFRDQQFWTAIKLLGNIGKWDFLLPESALKELMLDKLLNRYLMITMCSQTLYNNAVNACRKVFTLPLSWFKGENACLPQLQNFRNFLVQEVHAICKQQPPEDPNTRSSVVEVLQILSRIRCNDSIMAIAEKYHYEDAIYSHQLLNQDTT
uniref:GCF C-terminal domain-containing protein n=1 Tax=Gasterosteus aculeatus aculeatus TaxID=481459 RepID=A0AAQ4QM91_GASAC